MIEVGEYVRTKNNGIKKIDHLAINPKVTVNKYRYFLGYDEDGDRCYGILKTTDIVKHSKNIIDLIEVGDYVNGQKVVGVSNVTGWIDTKENVIYKDNVKSIVTHEQFEQIKYKVKE